MKRDRGAVAVGCRPIDDQFQVASHRQRPARSKANSTGTYVMYRTVTPTGHGSLARQSKTNCKSYFEALLAAPFIPRIHTGLDDPLFLRVASSH
jgi:hypothetical protein